MRLLLLVFSYISISSPLYTKTSYRFRDTTVEKLELKALKFNVHDKKEITLSGKDNKLMLNTNRENKRYFDSLSSEDKKVFVKLADLGAFNEDSSKMLNNYFLLKKEDGLFKLESFIKIPITFKKALPVIRDFKGYNNWALKGINTKRNGKKGKYIVDIISLGYVEKLKRFNLKIHLNMIFKGRYSLGLDVVDRLHEKTVPFFLLKITKPTKLAKNIRGFFKCLVLPGRKDFVIYFAGNAKLHWALYNFLPIRLLNSQLNERVITVLENISFRVEDI
jgi:hypothetical protein